MKKIQEPLQKASDDLQFAFNDLREAYSKAGAVEGLILLRLINQVVDCQNELKELITAKILDE